MELTGKVVVVPVEHGQQPIGVRAPIQEQSTTPWAFDQDRDALTDIERRHLWRVALAGDFNGWDPRAIPLERDRRDGRWAVTLALAPGRHSYAFVVDDSVWMRDPRSPEAADEDFGRPGSVLLVGQP